LAPFDKRNRKSLGFNKNKPNRKLRPSMVSDQLFGSKGLGSSKFDKKSRELIFNNAGKTNVTAVFQLPVAIPEVGIDDAGNTIIGTMSITPKSVGTVTSTTPKSVKALSRGLSRASTKTLSNLKLSVKALSRALSRASTKTLSNLKLSVKALSRALRLSRASTKTLSIIKCEVKYSAQTAC
jgi:hypothetical protein